MRILLDFCLDMICGSDRGLQYKYVKDIVFSTFSPAPPEKQYRTCIISWRFRQPPILVAEEKKTTETKAKYLLE